MNNTNAFNVEQATSMRYIATNLTKEKFAYVLSWIRAVSLVQHMISGEISHQEFAKCKETRKNV